MATTEIRKRQGRRKHGPADTSIWVVSVILSHSVSGTCYSSPRKLIWNLRSGLFSVNRTEPKRHYFTAVILALVSPIDL